MSSPIDVAPVVVPSAKLVRQFNVGVPVVAPKSGTDTSFVMHWDPPTGASSDYALFRDRYTYVRLLSASFTLSLVPTPGAVSAVMAGLCFCGKGSPPKTIASVAAGGGCVISAGSSSGVQFDPMGFDVVLKGVSLNGEEPALCVVLATGNSALEGSTVGYLQGNFVCEFDGVSSATRFQSNLDFTA